MLIDLLIYTCLECGCDEILKGIMATMVGHVFSKTSRHILRYKVSKCRYSFSEALNEAACYFCGHCILLTTKFKWEIIYWPDFLKFA